MALVYRLISGSRRAMAAYAYWSGQYAIIGVTPEYLFRKKGRYVQTMALAGTARNSQAQLTKRLKGTVGTSVSGGGAKKAVSSFWEIPAF